MKVAAEKRADILMRGKLPFFHPLRSALQRGCVWRKSEFCIFAQKRGFHRTSAAQLCPPSVPARSVGAARSSFWASRLERRFLKRAVCSTRGRGGGCELAEGDGAFISLPFGVSVALGAPVSAERLRRDIWINAAAALLLFSASDFAAQHMQHCKAHFGGSLGASSEQSSFLSEELSPPAKCVCAPPGLRVSLSSTANQLDVARMLAVALEGVAVNAFFLTPLYHKLEAVLAHNASSQGRRQRGGVRQSELRVGGGGTRDVSSFPSLFASTSSSLSAPPSFSSAQISHSAINAAHQARRMSRLLWVLSAYKMLAVQLVAVPVSTLSFLLFTPVLRAAFGRFVEKNDLENAPSWRTPPAASLAEGMAAGVSAVKNQFVEVFLLGCLVWPLSDLFNFRFMPLSLRPVWDSVVDLLWAAYLSFATHGLPVAEQNSKETHNAATAPE